MLGSTNKSMKTSKTQGFRRKWSINDAFAAISWFTIEKTMVKFNVEFNVQLLNPPTTVKMIKVTRMLGLWHSTRMLIWSARLAFESAKIQSHGVEQRDYGDSTNRVGIWGYDQTKIGLWSAMKCNKWRIHQDTWDIHQQKGTYSPMKLESIAPEFWTWNSTRVSKMPWRSFTKICCISHQVRPGKAKRCEVCSLLADISREDVESQPVDLTNNI